MLRYAYNTNGCANHRLDDALTLMAEAGYAGVALTIDWHHFDPFAADVAQRTRDLDRRLRQLNLGLVIETGARYLLDPRQKHEPTLITPDPTGRARRVEFLKRAVDLCAACEGECVSFWAGVPRADVDRTEAMRWLRDGVAEVLAYALTSKVTVSLEPEPGMLIETVTEYDTFAADLPGLTMALDVGHCHVTQEIHPAEAVRQYADHLGTVSVEDMKRGVHEHLPFGAGDLDVPAVLRALQDIHFNRLVCIELSRESPRAHEAIPQSIAWLRQHEND